MSDTKKSEYKKKWAQARVICECGLEFARGSLSRHRKSNKHKIRMESLASVDMTLENKIRSVFPLIDTGKLRRIIAILME